MTDQSAQEPTMEEILASIRRIISEDEAPAETAQAAAPDASEDIFPVDETAPEPFVEPEAAPEQEPEPVAAAADETPSEPQADASEDDVLELTDRYEAPAESSSESLGDLDISDAAPPEPTPEPAPEPASVEPAPVTQSSSSDDLVGAAASGAAASAFAGLTASLRMPSDSRSLEDLVKEMMRPMLKDWLDANLPAIVETQVRSEVERIARQGGR